jgi:hypothetical protein
MNSEIKELAEKWGQKKAFPFSAPISLPVPGQFSAKLRIAAKKNRFLINTT